MATLHTEIAINAPRPVVWEALVRKDEWRRWNTFLLDADPTLALQPGQEICLYVQRVEGEASTDLTPRVTWVQPLVCLRWVAKLPGYTTEYSFELQDLGPTQTLYVHQIRIHGVLSSVFLPFLRRDEKRGMQRMAHQLKRYVEHRAYRHYRQAVRSDRRSS